MNASHICLTKSLQFAVCFTSDEFAALPFHVIFPLSFGHLALFSSDLAARSAITAFRLLLLLSKGCTRGLCTAIHMDILRS